MLPRQRAEAVLVNTSGGLTGGDVLGFRAELGAGEQLTITTQAAERIYRSNQGQAHLTQNLHLGPNARLNWLPQETILYQNSGLKRRLTVDLAPGAEFLGLESYMFGRLAHGEVLTHTDLNDQWRIYRQSELIHAEALSLQQVPRTAATAVGVHAMATLVFCAAQAQTLETAARAVIAPEHVAFGVTCPRPDVIICRIVAQNGQSMRTLIYRLLSLFRPSPPPRVWQI